MDTTAVTEMLAAMGQPTRLQVLRLLRTAGGDGISAGEIAKKLAVPQNTMSAHLTVLTRAKLVTATKASRNVIYRADAGMLRRMMEFLHSEIVEGE